MVSKVRVFGKAQNRTVLGIVNAYMVVYPHATLADLDKAFPASLNSALKQFNLTSNFLTKEIIASRDADKMKCHFDDSPITLGDGKVVYLFSMWQKNDFERTVAFAEQYAIEVAEFKPIDGYRKGGYTLEYLNGFVPEVPKKKSNMMWIILAIVAVLAICAAIFLSAILR